ncbi:unnamed protein product, partial [Amoebophrya sp. A25]
VRQVVDEGGVSALCKRRIFSGAPAGSPDGSEDGARPMEASIRELVANVQKWTQREHEKKLEDISAAGDGADLEARRNFLRELSIDRRKRGQEIAFGRGKNEESVKETIERKLFPPSSSTSGVG